MVIENNLEKEMVTIHPIANIVTCKTNRKVLEYRYLVKGKTEKFVKKDVQQT